MLTRLSRILSLLLVVSSASTQAAPTVYTGYDVSFSKEAFSESTDPANQDMITAAVRIARGSTSGIYNAAVESSYMPQASPTGTEWAFPFNNPEATLTATAWESLNFDDWESAFGLGLPSGGEGPPSTVDQNAVLHLIDEDIYLDIRFTGWGIGGGGGGSFSYLRSALGAVDNADFNSDGLVDGEDFLIWQRNFGIGTSLGEGDADDDGDVDADDLAVWQSMYDANSQANTSAVPEPSVIVLTLLALVGSCGRSRKSSL